MKARLPVQGSCTGGSGTLLPLRSGGGPAFHAAGSAQRVALFSASPGFHSTHQVFWKPLSLRLPTTAAETPRLGPRPSQRSWPARACSLPASPSCRCSEQAEPLLLGGGTFKSSDAQLTLATITPADHSSSRLN